MTPIELRSEAPRETLALGQRLASLLRPGDVVLLNGRLGTGKTLLAAGIAEGLGVTVPVSSPSFVIVRRYDDGFLPLIHADVYRLGSIAEFEDLELEESAADGVLVIEWGEAVASALPEDRLDIDISMDGETGRTFRLTPLGSWTERSLEEVA
jgi:tRNA threonylcarbamoyladenosine biosynthesis protein TsaE